MPARDPLQGIPGVGPSIAADLRALGIRSVAQLKGRNPQRLYDRLSALQGPQDPCVLYTFRCAVYYATTPKPKPKLLTSWNCKDRS